MLIKVNPHRREVPPSVRVYFLLKQAGETRRYELMSKYGNGNTGNRSPSKNINILKFGSRSQKLLNIQRCEAKLMGPFRFIGDLSQ